MALLSSRHFFFSTANTHVREHEQTTHNKALHHRVNVFTLQVSLLTTVLKTFTVETSTYTYTYT